MAASEQALNARLDHVVTDEQRDRGDANIALLLLRLREQELEDALDDAAELRGELLEARTELVEARSDLAVMRRVMLDWLATT